MGSLSVLRNVSGSVAYDIWIELTFRSAAASMSSIAFRALFPFSPGFWTRISLVMAPTHFRATLVEVPNVRDPVELMLPKWRYQVNARSGNADLICYATTIYVVGSSQSKFGDGAK